MHPGCVMPWKRGFAHRLNVGSDDVPPSACRLATKNHGVSTSSRLVAPCRCLPSMKLSRRRLDHYWSCYSCHLHSGASSPASPGPCFGVSGGLLWPAWGALLELLSVRAVHRRPHWDALFPCRLPRPPERCWLTCQLAFHASVHLGLALLSVGHSKCHK
jgi:hypothetical protein